MDIGAAIKKLRLDRNLTQEELAERSNTSKPNISNLERNAQGFSPVILSSLGKAFGMRVSEIFRLAEELDEAEGQRQSSPEDGTRPGIAELLEIYESLPAGKRAALISFIRAWSESA